MSTTYAILLAVSPILVIAAILIFGVINRLLARKAPEAPEEPLDADVHWWVIPPDADPKELP